MAPASHDEVVLKFDAGCEAKDVEAVVLGVGSGTTAQDTFEAERPAMATVKQFRDRLQHTDEGIQRCVADGRTNAIDDYWLKVKADRVSLGELSLLYGVLARAIEGHHDITRDIVAAMPPE